MVFMIISVLVTSGRIGESTIPCIPGKKITFTSRIKINSPLSKGGKCFDAKNGLFDENTGL